MSFLKRVQSAVDIIKLEDIYSEDAQFKQFLNSVVSILYKFSDRFNLTTDRLLDIFMKQIKKEL